MNDLRDWLTTGEAAAALGVTAIRVRQWIADKRLPAQKIGSIHVIKRADVEAFRSRRKTTPGPEKGRPRATPRREVPPSAP
jgi:excisionase family DNA binding protein